MNNSCDGLERTRKICDTKNEVRIPPPRTNPNSFNIYVNHPTCGLQIKCLFKNRMTKLGSSSVNKSGDSMSDETIGNSLDYLLPTVRESSFRLEQRKQKVRIK